MPQDRQGITATLTAPEVPEVVGGLQEVGEEVRDTSLIDDTEAIESLPNTLPSDLEDIIHKIGDFKRALDVQLFDRSFTYKIGFYNPEINDVIVLEGVEKKVNQGSAFTIYEFSLPDAKPFVIIDKLLVGRVFFYLIPYRGTTKLVGLTQAIPELNKYKVPVVSSEGEYWKRLYHQERERRDEAQELIKNYLGMAQHELRTNVGIIRNAAELLTSGHNEPEFMNMIIDRANFALEIVNGLTLDTQSDNRRMYNPCPDDSCDITNVVKQMRGQIKVLKAKHGKGHLEVGYETPEISRTLVRASKENLTAILCNLVINAIKYTDKGTIKIRVSAADTNYAIEVSDTGIGIPSSIDPFAQYSRADNVGSREGSGLGLAIVKQIVDGYDGRISYTSKLGVGTTFRVELPLAISR